MSMIQVTNLTFSYPGSYDAVFDGVSFSLTPSGVWAFWAEMGGEKPRSCAC